MSTIPPLCGLSTNPLNQSQGFPLLTVSGCAIFLLCSTFCISVLYCWNTVDSQAVHRQAVIYPHISSTLNVSSHNQQTAQQPAAKVAPKQKPLPLKFCPKNVTKKCPKQKPLPLRFWPKIWPKVGLELPPAFHVGWKCFCWPFATKWLPTGRLFDFIAMVLSPPKPAPLNHCRSKSI